MERIAAGPPAPAGRADDRAPGAESKTCRHAGPDERGSEGGRRVEPGWFGRDKRAGRNNTEPYGGHHAGANAGSLRQRWRGFCAGSTSGCSGLEPGRVEHGKAGGRFDSACPIGEARERLSPPGGHGIPPRDSSAIPDRLTVAKDSSRELEFTAAGAAELSCVCSGELGRYPARVFERLFCRAGFICCGANACAHRKSHHRLRNRFFARTERDGKRQYASALAQNIEAVDRQQRQSPCLCASSTRATGCRPRSRRPLFSVRSPDQAHGTYALVVNGGSGNYQLRGYVNAPLAFVDNMTHRGYQLVILHIAGQEVYGYIRPAK